MSDLFRDGYVILRGVLGAAEVESFTSALEDVSHVRRVDFRRERPLRRGRHPLLHGWTLPDGVTRRREFWPVLVNPRLVGGVRDLLGPEALFLQHTDLHVGFSAPAWHRDSVDRRFGAGPDWDEAAEPYRIVRVAFYLQDHEENGFALRVVPGSQRADQPAAEAALRERRTRPLHTLMTLVAGAHEAGHDTVWIRPRRGDAIVFDPRLLHAGTAISGPKYSLFVAFGLPNRHYHRHHFYYRHLRPELGYQDVEPELDAMLRRAGLAPPLAVAPLDIHTASVPGRLMRLAGRIVRPGPAWRAP